jgi:hypothetical protein
VQNANSYVAYTGDGTSGIFIWGAQLEPVTYQTTPGTYNATTTAAYYGPRFDYDPVTLAPKGLLIEEARTNLLTYSEQFGLWTNSGATVTANSIVAPSGETSADTIVRAGFTSDAIYNTATFTGDGVKAVSIWIKKGTSPSTLIALLDATVSVYRLWADITWSGTTPSLAFTNGSLISSTNYGNGWWRLELATTAVTAANPNRVYIYPGRTGSTNGDTVYVWGAQAENATFATSYIPTVASTVTRSADVATMTGTNFSSWYNGSAGTFVTSADVFSVAAGDKYVVTIDGNAGRIHYVSTATMSSFDGTNVVSSGQTTTANSVFNTSVAWSGSTMSVCANGAAVVGGNFDGSWGTTSLHLGGTSGSGTAPMNGHIRQIAYYNTRLTNTELQTLTAPSLATTLTMSFTDQAYTVGV